MPDIIVVEDNVEIGGLLCDFLRKENYTVSLAETGRQALDLYEKYGAKLIRRVSSKALISVLMIISRNHTI